MKFSEAMALGEWLKMPSGAVVLSTPVEIFHGLRCGDALGGVIVALGMEKLWDTDANQVWYLLKEDYSWLSARHFAHLRRMYVQVIDGHLKFEKMLVMVRVWENIAQLNAA